MDLHTIVYGQCHQLAGKSPDMDMHWHPACCWHLPDSHQSLLQQLC